MISVTGAAVEQLKKELERFEVNEEDYFIRLTMGIG